MDSHPVTARRDGHEAVLRCSSCRQATRTTAEEFGRINDFMATHKACPPGTSAGA
jgi:hypothetical protein